MMNKRQNIALEVSVSRPLSLAVSHVAAREGGCHVVYGLLADYRCALSNSEFLLTFCLIFSVLFTLIIFRII